MGIEQLVKVGTCNLNQWALDFDGNLHRIIESISLAKSNNCALRVGPELEVSGYGCADHFLEPDTVFHCWQSMASIIPESSGILLDVGMPVRHSGVLYNCRVYVCNGKIVLIRPKLDMANDGNYRELRWFTPWPRTRPIEQLTLPKHIQELTGQVGAPFGYAVLQLNDTVVGSETCEELFTPNSPHIEMSLDGVEIISNGSGSHHNLGKLGKRLELINSATRKCGGVYIYANQQGCDGDRLYYDGCCMISLNGGILAQGSQFSVLDVELVTATIDLQEIRTFRSGVASRNHQSSNSSAIPRILVDFSLANSTDSPTLPVPVKILSIEEEIAYGPSCWLWDYLRRSGASGYFLPLSGGADSASTAALVSIMCRTVFLHRSDPIVLADLRRMVNDSTYSPASPAELCARIFHTTYMGTVNSSTETRSRAAALSSEIGAYHINLDIDSLVSAMTNLFSTITGKTPQFAVNGGTRAENLALQNIQARLRMVLSFFLAQLLPWVRGTSGFLLVLGSANVDEALRGYMTKYDCSSADLNPIGGISKSDLKKFLAWASTHAELPSLAEIVAAPPTAELEPITEDYTQSDEADMGMTYDELTVYGRLRKVCHLGPVAMYERLCHLWKALSPVEIAAKVKHFFRCYSINRHKLTVLTPAYHAENYSPDDNRFDLRQFLYNNNWTRQFSTIDQLAQLRQQGFLKQE